MPVRDTQQQPRHWFREESKKYMTVEMEQPFVWPKTPDLAPWGKEERKQEMKDSVAGNSQPSKREQRTSARTLQEEVKKLFRGGKKIQQNETAGSDSTNQAHEKKVEAETDREKLQRLTTLELWEKQRTQRVVRSEVRDQYAIKV